MAELAIDKMPVNVSEALATPQNNVLDLEVPLEYPITVRCTVVAGPIAFSQAGPATLADNPAVAATESIEMTLLGTKQLNFITTAQDDNFDLEVIRQRGQ
jgi:hypothetical protein